MQVDAEMSRKNLLKKVWNTFEKYIRDLTFFHETRINL